MRRASRHAAAALAVCLAFAAACSAGSGAETDRAGQPSFSAERAFAHIETQVRFGPRVPGTAAHARQLAWMTEFLRARADTVIVQPFTHTTRTRTPLELRNVLASFRPEARQRILLLAHWDTRPIADQDADASRRGEPIPGANDGASGVAVLLEIADVLSSHSPPIGVDLLFTDGEDYGPTSADMFLGAAYFASNLPAGYRPIYAVLVDMVAGRAPEFRIEEYSRRHAPDIVEHVWRVAARLGLGHVFTRRSWGFIRDDHVPLNLAGIPTINIIHFEYGPDNRFWHTHEDDLHNVAPDGLGYVGAVLLELIFRGG